MDKNNFNYFKTIERFFLSLKDSGLALSAKDYQLIGEWEERKIPAGLVCRLIESAYSKLDKQKRNWHGNISLTQIQAIVEEGIEAEILKK